MHSIISPSELWSTTPAPPAYLFEDSSMWMLHCVTSPAPLAFLKCEFYDEVNYYLPLYSRARSILYDEFTQLDCP